eukprot:scaffold79_cov259-Pinguiococcus_pyrenoidosus.AAC.25
MWKAPRCFVTLLPWDSRRGTACCSERLPRWFLPLPCLFAPATTPIRASRSRFALASSHRSGSKACRINDVKLPELATRSPIRSASLTRSASGTSASSQSSSASPREKR